MAKYVCPVADEYKINIITSSTWASYISVSAQARKQYILLNLGNSFEAQSFYAAQYLDYDWSPTICMIFIIYSSLIPSNLNSCTPPLLRKCPEYLTISDRPTLQSLNLCLRNVVNSITGHECFVHTTLFLFTVHKIYPGIFPRIQMHERIALNG